MNTEAAHKSDNLYIARQTLEHEDMTSHFKNCEEIENFLTVFFSNIKCKHSKFAKF